MFGLTNKRDFEALAEVLDTCRCSGHRECIAQLAARGARPIDAAVYMLQQIGAEVQRRNLTGEPALPAAPVAPIDLADMTEEDEQRVFYALLANRYDRRLDKLTAMLEAAGHGTPEECRRMADDAITRWCAPVEEDLEPEDLLVLLDTVDTKGISHA